MLAKLLGPSYKLESEHANTERHDRLLDKMPRDGERLKSFENSFYLMIENPLQRALSICR